MDKEQITNLLFTANVEHPQDHPDRFIEHYLEQYKVYLRIFSQTSDRRQKSNEFFLSINAAIIAILGYIETKNTFHSPVLFVFVPLIGVGICYSWYQIICSFKQLNRAKFAVIHSLERRLPAALFETEWNLLGRGKDRSKYDPLSQIEKNIPIMFIFIYIAIIITKLPWQEVLVYFSK